MISFVTHENQLRTGAYRKDEHAETLFKEMNRALAPLEATDPGDVSYPTLFIFGLPRSGTTLTYQLFAQCLDLGYVNNLIARFWLAPQHGIALSRAVLGPLREAVFQSDFGKTKGPEGPHEFAYFWQHWLKIYEIEDMLVFNRANPEIDWAGLSKAVRCMQSAFGSGIVFKTMFAANHVRAFSAAFPMPLFIYVERDPADVALSILSARKSYYGRADTWWATYPPDYRKLETLPFNRQIAGQVHSLRRTYEETVNLLPAEQMIRLTYSQLCESPAAVLAEVRTRLAEVYGFDLDLRMAPPERFEVRRKGGTMDDEQRAVVASVETWEETSL